MPATLASARVSPSGNVLLVRFGSNVSAVAAGATLTVNGGTPISLANPIWEDPTNPVPLSDWAWYPLGKVAETWGNDDGNPVLAGTWTTMNTSNSMLAPSSPPFYRVAYGDIFKQSSDPAATATHTYPGLTVGMAYDFLVNLLGLVGPDRTTHATYTLADGVGTLATYHVDETQNKPFDALSFNMRFTKLGTITPRTATVTVTIANAAGAGVLVIDAIVLTSAKVRVVPLGATVTLDAPAGTFTTAAGAVGAIASFPVPLSTANTWPGPEFTFDPAAPRTMGVGYNKGLPESGVAAPFYRDLMKQSSGWQAASGAFTLDSHGELASIAAGAEVRADICGSPGNGDDAWGLKTIPISGTFTLKCNYSGGGNPDLNFRDEGGQSSVSFGTVTWGANDPVSGKRVATCTYAMRQFQPLTTISTPYYPQYTYGIGLRNRSLITGVELYNGTPPAPGDPMTHPVTLDRLLGRGFASLRQLDTFHINNDNRARYSHNTSPLDISPEWVAYRRAAPFGGAVTAIAPVDTTGADADDAQKWFDVSSNTGVVKVTTASAHNLVTGQSTSWSGPTSSFASSAGPDLLVNDGNAALVVVLSATTFLQQMRYSAGNWGGPALLTLGTAANLTGQGYAVSIQLEPSVAFEDSITLAADCGTGPWVQVPYLYDDASVQQMADVTLAGTPAGRKIRVEYGNETWNTGFRGIWYYNMMRKHQAYLHALDPATYPDEPNNGLEWYAMRTAQIHAIFKARAALTGRAADIRRVFGSQAGWAGNATAEVANYLHRHSLPIDELTIDTYQDINPAYSGRFTGYPDFTAVNAAFARLDDEGFVDAYEISCLLGNRPGIFQTHRDVMSGNNSFTGVPFGSYFSGVQMTSYEGGLAYPVPTDMAGAVQRAHGISRHPRQFLAELKRLKQLQDSGCTLAVRYTLDKANVITGPAIWYDYPAIDTGTGTGDPAENANPYDFDALVSQTGGATRFWASSASAFGGGGAGDYALTPPSPASGPVAVASGNFTVALGSTAAVTPLPSPVRVTPSAPNGSFNPSSLVLTDAVRSGTFTHTPTAGGVRNVSTTNIAAGPARGGFDNPTQYGTNFLWSLAAAAQAGDIDFTFAAQVILTTKDRPLAIIAKQGDTSGEYLLFYDSAADRFTFMVWLAAGGTPSVQANALGAVATGTRYRVLAWHDSVANTVNIQVNGGTVDSVATGGALAAVTSDTLDIGRRGINADAMAFNGQIGPAAFWKRVLTGGERSAFDDGGFWPTYANLSAGQLTSLVSWWAFPASGTFADSTGAINMNLSGAVAVIAADPALADPPAVAYTATGSGTATTFTLTPATGSGTVGVARAYTVAPDGTYTGTITLTPSGCGLSSPQIKTFSGSSAPQTASFTPTSAGTLTITPANNGGLANPAAATASISAASSLATVLHDTFSGTAGNTIIGTVPSPVQNGSDVWELHSPGVSSFAFVSGGGAISAGTGDWYGRYELTGVPATQTITARFRFPATSVALAIVFFNYNPVGDNHFSCHANRATNQLRLVDNLGAPIAEVPFTWANGTIYQLVITRSATNVTVSVDGVGQINATVANLPGTRLYLAQQAGAAGDVAYESIKVQVAATATLIAFRGPAVGQVSVPSTNFTLTPDGTTNDVVTPSDGGAGGTFSPATLALAGTAPRTFTYTPASVGAKTISITGTTVPRSPPTRNYNVTITGAPDVAAFNKFNAFVRDLGNGVHHLNATDVLKIMLTLTAPVATNSIKADLTEIAAGNGYVAGGTVAASPTWTLTGAVAKLVANDVTFTASGGAIASFRYAVIYNDTPTSPAKPLIGFWDYGSSVTLATGESLLVDMDQTNGILTVT